MQVTDLIHAAGLEAVGWYHSHPTFAAQPSLIDLCNQLMQQQHHARGGLGEGAARGAGSHGEGRSAEPYVAAIISPYDPNIMGEVWARWAGRLPLGCSGGEAGGR